MEKKYYYQSLFDYMHQEHGLTLLESEMSDIIVLVRKMEQEPSPTPSKESDAVEFNSEWLAGRSKERFKELEDKGHDWRSFYIGWVEGRADAIADLIKKKKEQKEVKP